MINGLIIVLSFFIGELCVLVFYLAIHVVSYLKSLTKFFDKFNKHETKKSSET